MSKVPSQKFGSARPSKPKPRARMSAGVWGRRAESKPRGMPSASATTAAATASSMVIGNRLASSEVTGWPVRTERPASPWRMEPSHDRYCRCRGWSSPKKARMRLTWSGVSAVEVPSRAVIASPGMSRTNRNVTTETPTSVSGKLTRRFSRYAVMGRP